MSQELHYTSVPRGLKPGSRGFGTVAVTATLPATLADRLETLSAYQAVFPPGDPSEALNPVAYVHVRSTISGYVQDILSRIGPAGLDYSGRPNKYAHHVVLEPAERPDAGPAWLLARPGFVSDAWRGEPRILPAGPAVPRGDRPPGIAESWRSLTGDAGWAGVLAEAFLADPRRPVFVVFRPGQELLPLFAEAIALLPVGRRWDVEFTTYLTTLPQGVSCAWRGVLDGSPQAREARRLPNALIVDLGRPLGEAPGGGLVHLARTGERIDAPDVAIAGPAPASRPVARPPAVTAGPPPATPGDPGARPSGAGPGWLPDLAARLAVDEPRLEGEGLRRRHRSRTWLAPLAAVACLLAILAAAIALSPEIRQRLGLAPDGTAVAIGDPAGRAPAPVEKAADAGADASPENPDEGPDPATIPFAEADIPPRTEAPPIDPARPTLPGNAPPAAPIILAVATPEIVRSALGAPPAKAREIRLPEDAEDPIGLLNGPDFRLTPVGSSPPAWDVATRTGSGVGGGFTLARLSRPDGRTCLFQWTEKAKTQARPVESLRDTILALHARGGRPIYVLLRKVEGAGEGPLVVWKDQRILFDKPEPRVRLVEWAENPGVLEGSRWKFRILRWKVALSRTEAVDHAKESPRRVFEPRADAADGSDAESTLERDLVPGEVTLKLAIKATRPGAIEVRVESDPTRAAAGREDRAARMDELRRDTPADKDGGEQDPLAHRRSRLAQLREDGAKDAKEIQSVEREIADLERIREIRGTEGLLRGPARFELSVVIGLEVEGPGLLEIARIGEFARGR